MQELTTEPKTHVIMTWTKGEYFITEKQHKVVLNIGLNDKITIDGNTISGKAIAEVITIQEKRRRDLDIKENTATDYYPKVSGVDISLRNFTPEKRQRALEKVREGFKKCYIGREMTPKAEAVLKNIEFRTDTAQW